MIEQLINKLKLLWQDPKFGIHNGEKTIFKLSCEFSQKGTSLPSNFNFTIHKNLVNFWLKAESAKLFYDKEYGQWGLKILAPKDAIRETNEENQLRPKEYLNTDFIIGRFIGDADRLIICCDKQNNFGEIKLALPIDHREDWPTIAPSFADFLVEYAKKDGE